MDFERHQNDLRVQRKANRTLGAIVALLSLCQLLSLGVIAGMVGSERTIIVPPSIDKTFWVTGTRRAPSTWNRWPGS
jgi:conjugal transfer pilus assembly protein TraE